LPYDVVLAILPIRSTAESNNRVIKRLRFYLTADRLGPDMPITYLCSFYPKLMSSICKRKFKQFGKNSDFRPGATALHCSRISIGSNITIKPGCVLAGGISEIIIEDDVAMGYGIHIYASNHKYHELTIPIKYQGYTGTKPLIIRKNSWIGASCIILSGVEIGEHSVIAAGSVVTESVPPFSVAAGNPARLIKAIET